MTTITLAPITSTEHDSVIALVTHSDQQGFMATNACSLEEAAGNPACIPLLIRANGEPVGFAMYALDPEDNNYWIYRFMIDKRFQAKGYGGQALGQLVALIFAETGCPRIMLGVKPANVVARRLYERAGFRDAGFHFDGEDALVLERPA